MDEFDKTDYLMILALATFSTILLLKKRNALKKSKRKIWTRKWLQRKEDGKGILHMLNNELLVEDPDAYKNFLRLPNPLFEKLLKKVEKNIAKKNTLMRESISAKSRLVITLRFLATGESFRSLMYATRVHETTISRFVPEVCKAIFKSLSVDFLKSPSTETEWVRIARDFYDKWDFPYCLGALDGRHMEFRPPRSDGSYYYNYKGTNSIVLLALVGPNYEFLYVNVGINGRVSDGGVFRESGLADAIKNNFFNFPEPQILPGGDMKVPYIIVADDAFPLSESIMKPYSQRGLSYTKRIFNYRLSRTRRIVENAFGILANRFRILLNPINLCVEKVEIISLCCIALHNYLAKEQENYVPQMIEIAKNTKKELKKIGKQGSNRSTTNSQLIREEFCRFFNSPQGSRPWQDEQILKHNY